MGDHSNNDLCLQRAGLRSGVVIVQVMSMHASCLHLHTHHHICEHLAVELPILSASGIIYLPQWQSIHLQ